MSNTVRILRSTTAGNVPSSLASGQIAVNEADGRFFYRSAAGDVTTFSSIASFATTASFPAVGLASVLYLASDTSRLHQFVGGVYVEVGVAGGGVATTSASDLTSGTLPDARLSSAIATYSKIHQWIHNASATGVDVFPRGEAIANQQAQSGNVIHTFFTPTETTTVSSVTMGTGTVAAAGTTLARMGLYTFNESTGTLTLVARTANDTSLFAAAATAYTRSFDTTGGYPASYTLTAGVRYSSAVFVAATTLPNFSGRNTPIGIANLVPRTCGGTGSATDLAASPALGNLNTHVWARFS
jgi:hypothetical protein